MIYIYIKNLRVTTTSRRVNKIPNATITSDLPQDEWAKAKLCETDFTSMGSAAISPFRWYFFRVRATFTSGIIDEYIDRRYRRGELPLNEIPRVATTSGHLEANEWKRDDETGSLSRFAGARLPLPLRHAVIYLVQERNASCQSWRRVKATFEKSWEHFSSPRVQVQLIKRGELSRCHVRILKTSCMEDSALQQKLSDHRPPRILARLG